MPSALVQALDDQQASRDGSAILTAAAKAQAQADRRRKKRRGIVIGILCALIAIVIALIVVVLRAPAFRVAASSIRVVGANRWVSSQSVMKAAAPEIGKSIARVDVAGLEKRVSTAGPVRTVQVSRSLPNKLTIRVASLVPRAQLHDSKNRYALVDGTGRVISRPQSAVSDVPLIEVPDATAGNDRPILRQTLAILAQLPTSLGEQMAKVSAATRDSVTTVTTSGITIIWGDSQDMRLKVAIVQHLLGSPQMGDNKTIDVSSPQRPVLKK